MQFIELLDCQENIMNDYSKAPNSLDESQKALTDYDLLQDNKNLTDFRLYKLFRNMINSYCETEVERENKNKVEFQNTYNCLLNDFMVGFMLSKDGDENGNYHQTQ